jgi:hypothetical protein
MTGSVTRSGSKQALEAFFLRMGKICNTLGYHGTEHNNEPIGQRTEPLEQWEADVFAATAQLAVYYRQRAKAFADQLP